MENKSQGYGKIIHACLLCQLKKEPGYGYDLMSKLNNFGIGEEDINISTLYRSLKRLENSSYIKSNWEESGIGPNKKIYNITEEGIKELDNIMLFMEQRRDIIEKLLFHYRNITIEDRRG